MATTIRTPTAKSGFVSRRHNHARCVETAVRSAERICADRNLRLTAIRRRVLELVWSSHTPVVAYELLERLKPERANAKPPTVYRALEFLLDVGLIHRIESRNAFIGCVDPETDHHSQFLICTECGDAAELASREIDALITSRANEIGFSAEHKTIEITGRCAACRR